MSDGIESDMAGPSTFRSVTKKAVIASLLAGVALLGLASQSMSKAVVGPPAQPHLHRLTTEEVQVLNEKLRELGDSHTHLSQECRDDQHKIWEDVESTYAKAEEACVNLTWPNATEEANFSESKWDRHWECHHSSTEAQEAYKKHLQIFAGNCTEDFMTCVVTEDLGELEYASTKCFPKSCSPANIAKDGMLGVSQVPYCNNTNADIGPCAVKVACEGHDELDMDYPVADS